MKPIPYAYKRYRERHIKAGLCIQCSRKPKPGLLHCRVCLEKERKRRMERHPLFCPECGKLFKPEERYIGNRFHKLCAQKRRARREPPVHRRAVLAYQERHRKLGLCRNCPRKAFKGRLCRKHYRERAAG